MPEIVTTPSQATDNEEIDFLDYVEIIVVRRKMIFKVTAVAAVLSVIVALLIPKTYESTAMILPPQQEQGLMALMMGQMAGAGGLAGIAGGLLGASTPADMYATVLESQDIQDRIIDKFKLMEVYKQTERVNMYKKLEKIVDVKAGKKDGIISITVEDEEPKRAAEIANAYVDELAKKVATISVSSAAMNRSFLEGRLSKAKADLARAEDDVKAFQTRSKAIDVPEQAKASIEGIAMLKAQLIAQETQLSAVRSRFTDTSQDAMDIKATIANLKGQIAQMEGKGGGSSIIPTGSVPELGQEYVRLMREFKIQETLVELLTKQYELAKLSESKDVANVQVIQQPHVPDKKSKPKRILIVLGATMLGFIGAVSWAVLSDYVRRMPDCERQRWHRIRHAYARAK